MAITYLDGKLRGKLEVDRFLEKHRMSTNLNFNVCELAEYLGFKVYLAKNKDFNPAVLGSIVVDKADNKIEKVIQLNMYYKKYSYKKAIKVVSYLLANYYLQMKRLEIIENRGVEDCAVTLLKKFTEGTVCTDIWDKEVFNNFRRNSWQHGDFVPFQYEISQEELQDVVEIDPELYYFAEDLASRDLVFSKENKRSQE